MRKILVLFFIIFTVHTGIILSQANDGCNQKELKYEIYENHLCGNQYINKFPTKDLQFFNSWLTGDVTLKNGNIVSDKYLRYNGLDDQLLWIRSTDYQTVILESEIVEGFTLYNKDASEHSRFKKVSIKEIWETKDKVFMQVLAEGNISLYVYRKIGLIRSRDELFTDYHYYILKNGSLIRFTLNKRTLIKILPEHKKEIRSFIRKNLYSVKKEKNLIHIIDHLNQITE